MQISEPRKLFYKRRDKQILDKTDQLERELTGIEEDDFLPITEFLKSAVEDNPEYYPLDAHEVDIFEEQEARRIPFHDFDLEVGF